MTLKRRIGAMQLWAIAVGMVISGQYFGWNFGFASGGLYGLIIAAVIVTIFYCCFMFSYAELATAIPKAGGPSAYAHTAFGPCLGFISGMACLVEFLFAPPAIAVSIGSYLHFLIPAISPVLGTIGAFILCLFINLSGTGAVARFEAVITLLALLGLLIYYSAGLPKIHFSALIPQHHWLTHGITGIFASIPFAIWLFLCIEGGAMAAEEVKNPHKTISRGFIAAIVTLSLCSFFTILITACLGTNLHHPSDYPLPQALALAYPGWHSLYYVIDILGLLGLFASLNGIMIGYSRQTYALARHGYLPALFGRLSRRDVPHWALIIPGIIGLVCAGSAEFSNSLIILAVFGATLTYCISLLALFKLRFSQPQLARPFKVAYPFVPLVALILGVTCLASVFYFAVLNHEMRLFDYRVPLGVVALAIGVICLLYYGYLRFFSEGEVVLDEG